MLLKAVADFDAVLQRRFKATPSSLPPGQASPSSYPLVASRFRLIVEPRR